MKRAFSLLFALALAIAVLAPSSARAGGGGQFPFSFWKPSGPPPFNPATLPLDWWQTPDYPGVGVGPWAGTASAGLSGTHSNNAGSAVVGPAVNGHIPVHLVGGTSSVVSSNMDGYIQTAQFSGAVVFNSATAPPDNGSGSRALNAQLLANAQAFLGVAFESNGGTPSATLWMLSSFVGYVEQTTAATLNVWHCFQFEYDGTNIYSRVDGGSWSSGSPVVPGFNGTSPSSMQWRIGQPAFGNQTATADITEAFLSKSLFSRSAGGEFDNYLSYLRVQYAQPF